MIRVFQNLVFSLARYGIHYLLPAPCVELLKEVSQLGCCCSYRSIFMKFKAMASIVIACLFVASFGCQRPEMDVLGLYFLRNRVRCSLCIEPSIPVALPRHELRPLWSGHQDKVCELCAASLSPSWLPLFVMATDTGSRLENLTEMGTKIGTLSEQRNREFASC
jgi:hypothetical protein